MQFYEVIKNRRSIRNFKSTPVNENSLARMINAAMMAPSWKDNTSYRFILINDGNEKEMLAQTIRNDTNEAAMAVRQAPMVAVVVANPQESGVMADREYYLVDSAIAMEHFVLAATNEGYGTCWIGAFDEDRVREILSIPNNFRVVAMTPIGEVAEENAHHSKKDVREYVFLNGWGRPYTENISNNNENIITGIPPVM
ncbi:nitroreductase family protein [Thermohalobacter berrensis]|uniref:Nitroreductase n=1 Tax=Thermohalobacter berrensis TaxID=99594 RepID=A0A419SUD8_9FIRM|nr:nitroreductase family protein [Thermohalobacter berrensis]RKD28794.1 nitroreductase [Thermohalobacter berrensis]